MKKLLFFKLHNSTKLVRVLSFMGLALLPFSWVKVSILWNAGNWPRALLLSEASAANHSQHWSMHAWHQISLLLVNTCRLGKKAFTGTMWMVCFKFCLAERSYWKWTINTEQLSQTYACTDFALAEWGLPFIWNCSNRSQFGFMQTEGG